MKSKLSDIIEKENELALLVTNFVSKNKSTEINLTRVFENVKPVIKGLGKEEYRKKNTLSIRTGAIAIIEEELIVDCKRSNLNHERIIKKTRVRYHNKIGSKNLKKFNTIEKINPEKPCITYETLTNNKKINKSNAAKKRSYKDALIKIILGKDWILENGEAVISIEKTYLEVKEC